MDNVMFVFMVMLVAIPALMMLVSYVWKPNSRWNIDEDTLVDNHGWEYKMVDGEEVYVNGPNKT